KLHEREVGFSDLQAFQKVIVQSMPSGLITTDMTGKITSFNQSATEITGYRSEEVVGKIWWEQFFWNDLRNYYHDLSIAGTTQRFEDEIINKNGDRKLLGVTISALRSEQGKQIGMIGTFQDLTQIRNLEEAIQKKERLATIGEMAAGMAHEIRNPLASLSGSIQVLNKELHLSNENQKLLQIAVSETERLNTIITQFLLYAKPLPPRRIRVNLDLLLSETAQLIQNNPEYNERISVVLANSAEPLMILIDPDQIKQVFWNLAINAFQAMPQGGTLTLSAQRIFSKRGKGTYSAIKREAGNVIAPNQVEITFKDTGEGIKKGDLDKIFYPFFTTKSSGSGLGLAIVQRVIEEHLGKIEVQSGAGGTSFHIYLPLDERAVKAVPGTLPPDKARYQAEKRETLPIQNIVR
ncbi:MAG: nitrogen regulation protein NR(II), partial [Nitrospiria bacterium]